MDSGHNLRSLTQLGKEGLEALGLTGTQINAICDSSRPPIPPETLIQVLHDSAWCCCVCGDKKNPIIVHHIKEWHLSRDHSESNLAVLCLNHHDTAHSKKALSQNLTPVLLRKTKARWNKQVIRIRAEAITNRFQSSEMVWDLINAPRVFAIARSVRLSFRDLPSYKALRRNRVVDDAGLLQSPSLWMGDRPVHFLGDCGHTMQIQAYLGSLVKSVLMHLDILNLNEHWNQRELLQVLHAGMYVVCTAGHYFKPLEKPSVSGAIRQREMYRRADGIRLRAALDAWYALTTTSYSVHLTGHQSVTSIGLVKGIQLVGGELQINTSVLAVGTMLSAQGFRPAVALKDFADAFGTDDDYGEELDG